MDKTRLIEILQRIKQCIEQDAVTVGKELTQIELNNLKGITEQQCLLTKYYYYDCACKYCDNTNCNSHIN